MEKSVIVYGTHENGKEPFGWSLLRDVKDYIKKERGWDVYPISLENFPDSETDPKIIKGPEEADYIFVIHGFRRNGGNKVEVNDGLMELLSINDALKRASIRSSIINVLPYFPYARNDRKDRPLVSITAKLVVNLIRKSGADAIITYDLHAGQIQGFSDRLVDNLYPTPLFAGYVTNEFRKEIEEKKFAVGAPDVGSIKRNRDLARRIGCPIIPFDKERTSGDETKSEMLAQSVEGMTIGLVDDMISTGGSVEGEAEDLKKEKAKYVFAMGTHGLFIGKKGISAEQRLFNSGVDKIIITDSLIDDGSLDKRVEVLGSGCFIGEAIIRTAYGIPVSPLFI